MKNNQKGFGVVELLAVVVILGLVFVAGMYVANRSRQDTQDNQITEQKPTPDEALEYDDSELPPNWASDVSAFPEGGLVSVILNNEVTKCYIAANVVELAQDPKDSTDVAAIRAKYYKDNLVPSKPGQKFTEEPTTEISVKNKKDSVNEIEAQQFKGEGYGDVWYKKFAVVDVQKDTYARTLEIQCPKQADLTDAEEAALTIKF